MLSLVQHVKSLVRRDTGAALPMVIVVFLVSIGLAGAFLISIVGASQITSTTKASVQAQAAAEAGIAIAASQLRSGPCSAVATTDHSVGSGATARILSVEYGSAPDWNGTCESSNRLRIRAEGETNTADRLVTVETVFAYTPPMPTPPTDSVVLRSAAGLVLSGNSEITTVDETIPGDVYIEDGNFSCTGSGEVTGNVYVAKGTASLANGCSVSGDLIASGNVTLNKGNVGGHVRSVDGTASISSNSSVGGQVYQKTGGATGIPPELPVQPKFVDVTLANIKSFGFAEETWSGSCSIATGTRPTTTQPTVINAMSCAPLNFNGMTLTLRADLVIVAKSFNFKNVQIKSDGAKHQLWIVVPQDTPCAVGGTAEIDLSGKVSFLDGNIAALAYTACDVKFANSNNDPWHGSIYAKNVMNSQGLEVAYVPIGLPVAVADDDESTSNPSTGSLGGLVSQRNIS